jgi:putative SOS response-associated peptidase YedK
MCYDVASQIRSKIKYAKHYGKSKEEIDRLKKQLDILDPNPLWKADGFTRPKLLVVTNEKPDDFQFYTWKYIPFWAKDTASFKANTLNARDDGMWESKTYKQAAIHKRCLVIVDGFYEPHHYGLKDSKGKDKVAYYYIESNIDEPLTFAGLWSIWKSKDGAIVDENFAVITTSASPLLTKIHNGTKRMPAILPKDLHREWLEPITEDDGKTIDPVKKQKLMELIQPYDDELLAYRPVYNIRKRDAPRNQPEALQEYDYSDDLAFERI